MEDPGSIKGEDKEKQYTYCISKKCITSTTVVSAAASSLTVSKVTNQKIDNFYYEQ
jgi:hypothetical protein